MLKPERKSFEGYSFQSAYRHFPHLRIALDVAAVPRGNFKVLAPVFSVVIGKMPQIYSLNAMHWEA